MFFQRNGQHWQVQTPAKLNLYLEIIGRRNDGFHELETFMVSVDLFDTLRFRTPDGTTDLSLTVRSQVPGDIPADGRNLVWKAAELLRKHTGCSKGAEIDLVKRIPIQAGLGGGSSDAAATLAGLNRLWELGLSKPQLHSVAAELGSDVNFFIEQASAAVCRGRGESVEPFKTSQQHHFVIAHPGFGLSTPDVFGACSIPAVPDDIGEFVSGFARGRTFLRNRLSDAAIQLQPALGRLAERFDGANQMSGSGSTWFGIAPTRRAAVRQANVLRHTHPQGTAFAVSMI